MRHFYRLLSSRATLWSEMEKADDLLLSATAATRRLSATTQTVLQLGGSDPTRLAKAAKLAVGAHRHSITELNLNCGCPSIEAGGADFGAALMRQPALVAACVSSMADASSLPVSVKCRVAAHESLLPGGMLPEDKYEALHAFVDRVNSTGALAHVVLHARAAVLTGLSPAKNRQVPALRYDYVERLAQDFPRLRVTLNGGVNDAAALKTHLANPRIAGVMVGRWMLRRPLDLYDIHETCLGGGGTSLHGKSAAVMSYAQYAVDVLSRPGPSELAPVVSEVLCPLLLVSAQLQDDWAAVDEWPPPDLPPLTAAVCNAAAHVLDVATRGAVSLAQIAIDDAGPGSLRKLDRSMAAACGKKVHAKLLRSRRES